MTKKIIRNCRHENGIFFRKKRHSEILVREICFRPSQTRRQVSATGVPLCFLDALFVLSQSSILCSSLFPMSRSRISFQDKLPLYSHPPSQTPLQGCCFVFSRCICCIFTRLYQLSKPLAVATAISKRIRGES